MDVIMQIVSGDQLEEDADMNLLDQMIARDVKDTL